VPQPHLKSSFGFTKFVFHHKESWKKESSTTFMHELMALLMMFMKTISYRKAGLHAMFIFHFCHNCMMDVIYSELQFIFALKMLQAIRDCAGEEKHSAKGLVGADRVTRGAMSLASDLEALSTSLALIYRLTRTRKNVYFPIN
jgi:hypothetical protein